MIKESTVTYTATSTAYTTSSACVVTTTTTVTVVASDLGNLKRRKGYEN